jgi:ATP-binding cassette subfamily F protein uup
MTSTTDQSQTLSWFHSWQRGVNGTLTTIRSTSVIFNGATGISSWCRASLDGGTDTDRSLMANLVNLERVGKAYDVRKLLDGVSLGVAEGERIGVVGANGTGKTTLLRLLAGVVPPDSGRVAQASGLRAGLLAQQDTLDPSLTVAAAVVGDRPAHEWQADRRVRDILTGLLADVPYDKQVGVLSGGERRRTDLARLLMHEHDLLLLDEPTNHLDIEVTNWLARHLSARREAVVVVTHDRWFLDEVSTATWELVDGRVEAYEGGYSAYVLAKAERARQAEAAETRRQNLMRKELAWLHRGAKARTSKPKFRVEAAASLIADEPPPRDAVELAKFATTRLGKTVIDLEDVDIVRGQRTLLNHLTWQFGPGDRIGVVGVNGAGKTSLLRVLAGEDEPTAGRVTFGRTVSLAHLAQEPGILDPQDQVLDAIEKIRRVTKLGAEKARGGIVQAKGPDVSVMPLLERFGFRGGKLQTRVGDLSGGERRRLELLALLLEEPNVLLLDEPTNDLDIETLQVLEDYLDGWPGSLVVITHDRYFLERVTDSVWALLGDGRFAMLPGGVDEYLERRQAGAASRSASAAPASASASAAALAAVERKSAAAEERAAKKELAKLERQLAKLTDRETKLHAAQAEYASDYERLMELDVELREVQSEKEAVETRWLELAELVE